MLDTIILHILRHSTDSYMPRHGATLVTTSSQNSYFALFFAVCKYIILQQSGYYYPWNAIFHSGFGLAEYHIPQVVVNNLYLICNTAVCKILL